MLSILNKIFGSIFKSSSEQSQEIEVSIQEVETVVEETPKEAEVVEQVVEPEVIEVPQEPVQKSKKLSKERFDKIQILHQAITETFKFAIVKSRKRHMSIESVEDIEKDVDTLRAIENKISITSEDNNALDKLFSKYNIK
jgi:hypothetical protein